jgi:ribosomal protein L29
MKFKEKQNFIKTNAQELAKEVSLLEEKLKKLKVERHVKQMKNSREGRTIQKRIAVLKTFIHQKQIATQASS